MKKYLILAAIGISLAACNKSEMPVPANSGHDVYARKTGDVPNTTPPPPVDSTIGIPQPQE